MLPVNIVAEVAAASHVAATGHQPAFILRFTLPFFQFHVLVQSGHMVPCLHVGGYRIYQDLQCQHELGVSWDNLEIV